MKPEFTFLQAIMMSFYSKRLYRDVFHNWYHSGLFYSLKLSIWLSIIIMCLMFFLISKINIDQDLRTFSHWLVGRTEASKEQSVNRIFTLLSTLPNLEYKNQTLATPKPTVAVIHDPVTKNALFTINTTDKQAHLPYRHNTPYFMVTKSAIVLNGLQVAFAQIANEEAIQDFLHILKNFPDLQLSHDRLVYTGEDPFIITKKNSKDPLVIIDTSNNPAPLHPTGTAWLMFSADSISFKSLFSLSNTITTLRWDKLSSDLVYEGLKHSFSLFQYSLAFIVMLFTPIFIFILFIIQSICVVAYSGLAFLYTQKVLRIPPHDFSFQACIKLCSVAITPIFLFAPIFLLYLFSSSIPLFLTLLYPLFGLSYVYYAIISVLNTKALSPS